VYVVERMYGRTLARLGSAIVQNRECTCCDASSLHLNTKLFRQNDSRGGLNITLISSENYGAGFSQCGLPRLVFIKIKIICNPLFAGYFD